MYKITSIIIDSIKAFITRFGLGENDHPYVHYKYYLHFRSWRICVGWLCGVLKCNLPLFLFGVDEGVLISLFAFGVHPDFDGVNRALCRFFWWTKLNCLGYVVSCEHLHLWFAVCNFHLVLKHEESLDFKLCANCSYLFQHADIAFKTLKHLVQM